MCFAVIEVKLKSDKERTLKRIESRDQLAKELRQLERMGTVEKVTVFYNHHTHKLTETWVDEMYHEPEQATADPPQDRTP